MRLLVLILCVVFMVFGFSNDELSAQSDTITPIPLVDPLATTAYRQVMMYAGPGDTFRQLGWLRAGVPVQIFERNRIGNWLHVRRTGLNASDTSDGWVLTGYLNIDSHLRFSEVTVNLDLPDADVTEVAPESVAHLYAAPIIPEVGDVMREVYNWGQALGNHSNVVTKIGDSLTADEFYLNPFGQPDYDLGPYDYLKETIEYFGDSMESESAAARIGLTTYVVFDPLWTNSPDCLANEAPLSCEYRLKKPSIALIMFGPNDVLHISAETYDEQMREIVDETLAAGIIPVLSTFSYSPDARMWWPSVDFNLALVDIAEDYEIPLINLWAASRVLPDYGLEGDGAHMTHSGFPYIKYSTGHESWYGVSLRNLLSIRMLDEIRRTLDLS
jgi:hypothetical protein